MTDFYSEIKKTISEKNISKDSLNRLKIKLSKKYSLKKIPTEIDILMHCSTDEYKILKNKLITKPGRTGSGVTVIAVMSKPYKCPHGKCIMCPGGPESEFGKVPQSYTGNEPATMRGIRNHYDPYLQIFNRLEQYIVLGQEPQKIELIIMGGTFPSIHKTYKNNFIRLCYKALNDFSDLFYKNGNFNLETFKAFFELPGNISDKKRSLKIKNKCLNQKKLNKVTYKKEQEKNETSHIRCIGLTIETRPDFGKLEQGLELLDYGCTRVELGIQSTHDDILKKIDRGHTVQDSIDSSRILRDLGFKLNYHMMPGLPGSNLKKDLDSLIEIIRNPDFRPDMLKIYPCMVLKGTKLYDLFKKGDFNPITTDKAAKLIAEFKRYVPEWLRIMRVQRDIPTNVTIAGVDKTNLRQYVKKEMDDKKIHCRCIRCREPKGQNIDPTKAKIWVMQYPASHGTEFFISSEIDDMLLGFCRLRFPSQLLLENISKETAMIRELHVYGTATKIGKKISVQHKGIGKSLLRKAEDIAKENNKKHILVISGIGVKEYYKKLGYQKEGPYMGKKL